MRRLSLLLWGLACLGAPAASAFEWAVPAEAARVDVAGVQQARGIPVKLEAATSRLPAPELLRYFAGRFRERGLFIPPEKDQLVVAGALQLTALDVDRLLAYTVLLRPLPRGRGTQVLMSTADLEAARGEGPAFVALPPDASSVVTVDVESARSVSFATPARPEQVAAFYREVLTRDGYHEREPGVFERGSETLRLHTRPLGNGRLGVVVREQRLPDASAPVPEVATPHPQE
jgi:hypothetical protein